jgi:hypothetical protein
MNTDVADEPRTSEHDRSRSSVPPTTPTTAAVLPVYRSVTTTEPCASLWPGARRGTPRRLRLTTAQSLAQSPVG